MGRLSCLAIALLAISAPAFGLIVNGSFETGTLVGWTVWTSPWDSGTNTVEVTSATAADGIYSLHIKGTYGSFGVVQGFDTVVGQQYTLAASWRGNNQSSFWNELLFFSDDGRPVYDQLDAPYNSSVISKVDGWGMNPPAVFPWKSAFDGTQWFPSGPHTATVVATSTRMYVGLKAGTVAGSYGGTEVWFDGIGLVPIPEPASLLALTAGLGALAIRRRR